MFTNELLTKEFPHERPWEALVRSKSGNLTLTNQAGMGPAGLFTASTGVKFVDKDTSFEAMLGASGASTLEFKYLLPGGPMRGLLLMSRFERVKIAAAAAAVKQSDGSVKAIPGPAVPSDSVEFGVEYVMPAVTAKLSIDPFLAAFKSSLTLACTPNVKAGMDVSGGLDRGSILKYGGGLMYTEKGLVASLQTLQEGTNPVAGVAANFQIRPEGGRSELVGEWKYSLLTSAANATFAGRYMLDDKTELRARITPDAKVALNVTHLVSPLFSAGLGVQVDPQLVLADKPEAVRWGIKLAFEQ